MHRLSHRRLRLFQGFVRRLLLLSYGRGISDIANHLQRGSKTVFCFLFLFADRKQVWDIIFLRRQFPLLFAPPLRHAVYITFKGGKAVVRRLILLLCILALLGLVTARSLLPEPEPAQTVMAGSYGYNVLNLDLSLVSETAGSALLAEMNHYYLFRTPTAKNECTGLLAGKNLIVICADNWSPDLSDRSSCPTLYRLWQDGASLTDVYRPDWYQGMDGREFALLTGVIPTNVNNTTALVHTGEQNIFFPYSPARVLGLEGYATLAFYGDEDHRPAYEALGFSFLSPSASTDRETVEASLAQLPESGPFFAYYVWSDHSGEEALSALMSGLEALDLEDSTAICILTANSQSHRAHLFFWGNGLRNKTSHLPCSELDIVPTLLNLFGVAYDSRFLSGRDVFAPAGDADQANSLTPLVTLYGSAYSDWVTPAGSYVAAHSLFWQKGGVLQGTDSITSYVNTVNQLVYDRYVFARRVMENNYFQIALGSSQLQAEEK